MYRDLFRYLAALPFLIPGAVLHEVGLIVAGSDARLTWRFVMGAA